MHVDTDVLIVGAGPTGLTLATLLRRGGIRCRVIDKVTAPSTTSKAIGLQYRVSEVLAWMGLVDRFIARAAEQTTVNLLVDGKVVTQLRLGSLPEHTQSGGFVPRAIILPQSETETILGEALVEAGGAVEWGTPFVSLQQDEDGVDAELADGRRLRAHYLVSCEGAHSVARKACSIAFEGRTYPHDFIMADVEMKTSLESGQAYSFLHSGGVVSAITMPGDRRWRLFIEAGAAVTDEVTLDLVRDIYRVRTGDHESEISNPTWLTRFKIHARVVDRFRVGRVFLAGDAAHLHSPSGGQGIATGVADATNLAWKLVQVLRHAAPLSLLDTYEEERKPAARDVIAATDRNTKLLFAEGAVRKWLRNHLFVPLLGTRFVQGRLMRKLSQLDVDYRASSIAHGAGQRAPDAALSTTTVFGLLRQQRMVALLTTANLAPLFERLGMVVHLIDTDEARLVYPRDVYVLRPDGYVLLAADRHDHRSIERALSSCYAGNAVTLAFASDRKANAGNTVGKVSVA